jgi:hypothetical protein
MIQIISNNDINNLQTQKSTREQHSCSKPTNGATTTYDDERTSMTRLAHGFTPGPFDVICARGKEARNHNKKFREKIKQSVDAYAKAETKLYKSLVVSSVVDWFREASPNGAGFVKESNGVWFIVPDQLAREKVGQALRDQLHSQYKSSTKAKRQRWKKEEQEKVENEGCLDDLIKENHSITERMQNLDAARDKLGGDDASDESLMNLFTQNNCFILNAIHSDPRLQEGIKNLSSCQN